MYEFFVFINYICVLWKEEYQLNVVVQSRTLLTHFEHRPHPSQLHRCCFHVLATRVIIFIITPFVLIQQTKVVKDCTSNSDFVGKWNFYYPAVSPVYASDFLTFQKRTLLLPWHQTKLYRKLFPLDLSLLQEMVFEARRLMGMRCLQLDRIDINNVREIRNILKCLYTMPCFCLCDGKLYVIIPEVEKNLHNILHCF